MSVTKGEQGKEVWCMIEDFNHDIWLLNVIMWVVTYKLNFQNMHGGFAKHRENLEECSFCKYNVRWSW